MSIAPAPVDASTPAAPPPRSSHFSRGLRETVESIAIALILAFLFKTFEAEAFVIPTGSMAPTLMGRHKDVTCPECGYQYTASGSEEADENGNDTHDPDTRVIACTCPICRFTMPIEPEDPAQGSNPNPSYTGDRIWVSKIPYHFTEPERFDVLVFRYPQGPEQYYIKRLVGLPNETLQIYHGDLFVKGDAAADADYQIVRKSPEKLKAMAQIVHDNDYVSQALIDKNWPMRWQEWGQSEAGYWQVSDDTRNYSIDGKQPGDAWIRYEHTVPSEATWFQKQGAPPIEPRPQLITDFYAFNTQILRKERGADPQSLGLHWVGDLLLECQLDVKSDSGTILLDLVKGGRHFGCHIDVATGKATLSIDGLPTWKPTADTPIRGGGSYDVTFANADRQLVLWVNGKAIAFDGETTYENLDNDRPQSTAEDPGDLAPLGIGSRGVALDVSHLRVLRDIYYIADTSLALGEPISDYPRFSPINDMNRRELATFFATPARWNQAGATNVFDSRKAETFPLGPDQYFVLGDNSPASSDARLWSQHYVDRDLLVGKALMIYWPHALRLHIPGTDAALGVIPNVPEMGLIR